MADSWQDTKCSPDRKAVSFDTNINSGSTLCHADDLEQMNAHELDQTATNAQDRTASVLQNENNLDSVQDMTKEEETRHWKYVAKSKRDRVENIVTSIKDKPSKLFSNEPKHQTSDLSYSIVEKKDTNGNNVAKNAQNKQKKSKEKIYKLQQEISELQKDFLSDIDSMSINEEKLTKSHQDENRMSCTERDDFADCWAKNSSRKRKNQELDISNFHYSNRLNIDQSVEQHPNFKNITMTAYNVLVESLKRELSSTLEEVVNNSAKCAFEEMQNHLFEEENFQSLDGQTSNTLHGQENNKLLIGLIPKNENYSTPEKRYPLTPNLLGMPNHFRTANQFQMCFGDVQVSKDNTKQNNDLRSSEDMLNYQDVHMTRQHTEWDDLNHFSPEMSSENLRTSESESKVQSQPLNLVKRSIFSPACSISSTTVSSPSNDCPFVSLSMRIDSPRQFSQNKIPADAIEFMNKFKKKEKSLSSDRISSTLLKPNQHIRQSITSDPRFYRPSEYQFIRQSNHSSMSLPCLDSSCTMTDPGFINTPHFSFSPNTYSASDTAHLNYSPFLPINDMPFPPIISSAPKPQSQRISQYDRVKRKYERSGASYGPRKTRMLRNHDHVSKQKYYRYGNMHGDVSAYSSYFIQEGLTPQHLKKAKLMFFYTRYPSAITIKTFFSDVKFSRATTSQLVKWFSNFREFYYIQMEKFARQALSDGVTEASQLTVTTDSEIFRVLNHHYNKSNDFKIPPEFITAVMKSLQEFFTAIQDGKDNDPSWKKVIYKVVCKYDQEIPEIFKSRNVLENLHKIL